MPELPEVETVCRAMARALTGEQIINVCQNRPDLRCPFPAGLKERLEGQTINNIARRAKYIVVYLSGGEILLMHLGMSGVITLLDSREEYGPRAHDHLIMNFFSGKKMIFYDPRRFGRVDLLANENELGSPLSGLGPEPLGNDFSAPYLIEKLAGKIASIKQVLLDQRVVAGLGNIYVCEALYHSGIHPQRLSGTLTVEEAELLVSAIRDVLNRSIEAGGSSLKDYRHTDGQLGYFQNVFSVYNRAGQACPRCRRSAPKAPVIERLVQSGRSSFYCPQCQK